MNDMFIQIHEGEGNSMKKKLFAMLLIASVCARSACGGSSDAQSSAAEAVTDESGTETTDAADHEHDWVAQTVEVHHDAEGMFQEVQDGDETVTKWVETTAAWDETVTTGYTCSICGAEQ
jgi:DNA-directed RNA polymerase subunit M/transcription elongation factor TFIIS